MLPWRRRAGLAAEMGRVRLGRSVISPRDRRLCSFRAAAIRRPRPHPAGGLSEPGLSEQRPDPIAAALEVIVTSQPAADRGPLPASGQEPGVQPSRDPLSTLTPRETEVLHRIAEGQNTKKMAQEMRVTTATLRTYVRNVLTKLGAHSRLEAATLASQCVSPARREPGHDHTLFAALTPREREVLVHLANGSGLREVGERLHMSPKTLSTHLQNLRNKLGVHSTLEAVALARSRFGDRSHAD